MKKRLFVGLPVSTQFTAHYCQFSKNIRDSDWYTKNIRLTPPKNLHITVSFIGYVDEVLIPDVQTIIHNCAGSVEPILFRFKGLCLAPPREPRMIWAVFEENKLFRQLVSDVGVQLEAYLGKATGKKPHIIEKREVVPHITFARDTPTAPAGALPAFPMKKPMVIRECRLYESKLFRSGARYTRLSSFRFTRTAGAL